MGKAEVLSLLRDGEYVSGEEISRALGVTRAAVWKAVQALRADGCSIDSVPNRGYCLHRPESALSDAAVHALLEGCPWPVSVLPTVDSTNTYAKAQAALGAPHGSVYITGRQTGGRGRARPDVRLTAGRCVPFCPAAAAARGRGAAVADGCRRRGHPPRHPGLLHGHGRHQMDERSGHRQEKSLRHPDGSWRQRPTAACWNMPWSASA